MNSLQKDINFLNLVHQSHQIVIRKKNPTNNVLKISELNRMTYFIPLYCRLLIKNVLSNDFESLSGQINADLIISLYYGGLSHQYVHFLKHNMCILFQKDQPLKLEHDDMTVTMKKNKHEHLIHFTVRKIFATEIRSQIQWAPFQMIKHILSIKFEKLTFQKDKDIQDQTQVEQQQLDESGNPKEVVFRFNLMDLQQKQQQKVKISWANEKGFGMYTYADKIFQARYSNDYSLFEEDQQSKFKSKNQQMKEIKKRSELIKAQKQSYESYNFTFQEQLDKLVNEEKHSSNNNVGNVQSTKIKSQHQSSQNLKLPSQFDLNDLQHPHIAHFLIPMYKQPLNVALKIFFPLVLLGIINLGIIYQDKKDRGKQVLNMAALMISFVSLLPTIRQNMAKGSGISFLQVCVVAQAMTTIITMINIIWHRFQQEQPLLENDFLEIMSMVVTSVVSIAIIILSIVHQKYWKRYLYHSKSHNQKQKELITHYRNNMLHRKRWGNKKCDECFNKLKQYKKLIVIVQPQIKHQRWKKPIMCIYPY